MIHVMNNEYIDITKLEKVSDIMFDSSPFGYYFRYSINGFTWDYKANSKDHVKQIRDSLLHSWYLYKESK